LVVHADVVLLPVAADRDDEGRLGRLHLRSQSRPPIGQLVVAKPAVRLFPNPNTGTTSTKVSRIENYKSLEPRTTVK
jgi:hypothetical protein